MQGLSVLLVMLGDGHQENKKGLQNTENYCKPLLLSGGGIRIRTGE
jgi:hypothetical protein